MENERVGRACYDPCPVCGGIMWTEYIEMPEAGERWCCDICTECHFSGVYAEELENVQQSEESISDTGE